MQDEEMYPFGSHINVKNKNKKIMELSCKMGMQSLCRNKYIKNSTPVTFTVRNSTVHVIYEIWIVWFVHVTSGKVLLVVVLHIRQ